MRSGEGGDDDDDDRAAEEEKGEGRGQKVSNDD
jgi:hypothetical protein